MTSEEFAPVSTVPVNLRQAAMDLVHRLSSLRDFIPAANDLATCDSLPPKDVQRHCRKVPQFALLLLAWGLIISRLLE